MPYIQQRPTIFVNPLTLGGITATNQVCKTLAMGKRKKNVCSLRPRKLTGILVLIGETKHEDGEGLFRPAVSNI